jgi:Tol biopolymer transport system component
VSLLLALLTVLLIWRGPAARMVDVVTQAPTGEAVPVGAPIRVIFSQPVDRLSVEQRFRLTPEAAGHFFWEGQAMTFQPTQPLRADTTYRVTLEPGIADQAARTATQEAIGWTFRTRASRLLLRRQASDGAGVLLLASPDGSDVRELLREPGGITDMEVAPDGSQALITVPRTAERSALLLVDLDTGTTRPLLDSAEMSAHAAAWSPTGELIAYVQRTLRDGTAGEPAIWLAQPDGTSLGPVTEPNQRGTAPAWSPDGSRLAFTETTSQTVTVYAFTSAFQTFPNSGGAPATWAPDSAALIYADAQGGLRRASLEADTTNEIAPAPDAAFGAPAWSPDGAWVAVVRREAPAEEAGALWVLRPDGSAPRQLTEPDGAADSAPVWSPDSQHLAFVRRGSDGSSAAWVLDPDSGALRQVAENSVQVAWVP